MKGRRRGPAQPPAPADRPTRPADGGGLGRLTPPQPASQPGSQAGRVACDETAIWQRRVRRGRAESPRVWQPMQPAAAVRATTVVADSGGGRVLSALLQGARRAGGSGARRGWGQRTCLPRREVTTQCQLRQTCSNTPLHCVVYETVSRQSGSQVYPIGDMPNTRAWA